MTSLQIEKIMLYKKIIYNLIIFTLSMYTQNHTDKAQKKEQRILFSANCSSAMSCSILSLVCGEWFLFLSPLQHHLFYIWSVSDDEGVFCEMSARKNPGSYWDDKKRPLILNWTTQIPVGRVCFALSPHTYGDTCARVGVPSLLTKPTINLHSPFLVMWL